MTLSSQHLCSDNCTLIEATASSKKFDSLHQIYAARQAHNIPETSVRGFND